MYNKKGADEHFKIFLGFKDSVCTNLCVSSDGLIGNLIVKNIISLAINIRGFLESFNHNYLFSSLQLLSEYYITVQQFANMIGRCRIYQYLPKALQNDIPLVLFCETQH